MNGPDQELEMVSEMDDAAARRKIQECLDQNLMVEAAAGTGKTTVLVNRLVSILGQGKGQVEGIVAVTFTRKAAGELKLRLRQELERARAGTADPGISGNLQRAISRLEEARIGTIHSFCGELLRERPVEAVIDPDFSEVSEDESQRLFDRAFRTWIQQKLNQMPEALSRALARLSTWSSWSEMSPLQRLRDAGWKLSEWRDFEAPWRPVPFQRSTAMDPLVDQVSELAALSEKCTYKKDGLRQSLEPARLFRDTVEKAEQLRPRDYDDLEARLIDLLKQLKRKQWKGRGSFGKGVSRSQVLEARSKLIQNLESFKHQADAHLVVELRSELLELVSSYSDLKRQTGGLDFVDLLIRARDLIKQNRKVREHLQSKFTHVFVDEFQDTDPLQAEILLLLSADDPAVTDWRSVSVAPGKLFLVGDPKQSIYRFRRADVVLYQEVKEVLQGAGVEIVYLRRNFRSLRPVQQTVNAAFAPEIVKNIRTGQPDYVPLLEHLPSSKKHPSVIALPVPHPYGWRTVTKKAVEESLPDVTAAFIEWLLSPQCDWLVRNPEQPEEEIPIQARHICVLFRRFMSWGRDMTRPYIRGLDARGVPHLLVGSRTFHQREEIETLRAALAAIEWPDDELAVYGTLRGSLFSIPDELLFRFRKQVGRLHPFKKVEVDSGQLFEPVVQGLELLAQLHRRRNRRPVVDTLNSLLEFTRAHAGFALRPAGAQVLANVQRICDMARRYELTGGISFRGFVELLSSEAGKARSNEAPVLEEGAEGVRVMTLHSAKGLEFPIVILGDITCSLSQSEPDQFIDRNRNLAAIKLLGCSPLELQEAAQEEQESDQAEGVRIAYVAATRARDILIVPVVGDGTMEGWTSPLSKAIYPADQSRRDSKPATGCPTFGEHTVLSQPSNLQGTPRSSVRPGLHHPQSGNHSVVWWDPAVLNLGATPNFGLKQQDILAEDSDGLQLGSGLSRYYDWRDQRKKALESGKVPAFKLFTASGPGVAAPAGFEARIETSILDRPDGRPSGRRFGTLVHTILRDVDLGAGKEVVEGLARCHARALKATPVELQAACESVFEVLKHPLIRRACCCRRSHRELPLLLNLDDGRTFEGVIDLAFFEDSTWNVVDFKTDAHLSEKSQRYTRQIEWYLLAMARLTHQPVQGWLLGV